MDVVIVISFCVSNLRSLFKDWSLLLFFDVFFASKMPLDLLVAVRQKKIVTSHSPDQLGVIDASIGRILKRIIPTNSVHIFKGCTNGQR